MSRFSFSLLFLVAATCCLTNGSILKSFSQYESDNFHDLSSLEFNKFTITDGNNPIIQLICHSLNAKDDLCSKYGFENAKCQNLNFNKTVNPKWKCELSNAHIKNPNVQVDHIQVICENFNGSTETYVKDSCSLRYSLRKNSNYNEIDDKTDDGANKNGLWIALYILLGLFGGLILLCCFVCFVIPNKYCCPNCTEDDKVDFFSKCCGKCMEECCAKSCERMC